MIWISISRLITCILGVFIGMLITVRHYEEKINNSVDMADEECLKCKHHESGGCDTWCENGEAFETLN